MNASEAADYALEGLAIDEDRGLYVDVDEVVCQTCGGSGEVEMVYRSRSTDASPNTGIVPCPECNGTEEQGGEDD